MREIHRFRRIHASHEIAINETKKIMKTNDATEQTMPVPLVYTVEEAAAVLKVSTKSIRRLIARGLLTGSKALRKILIPRTQIEAFLMATCDVPKTAL